MKLALIRLLSIIEKHGQEGVPTRRLLQQAGANELHRVIKEAEAEGLVRREQVRKPKGQKGNFLTVNHLTESGKQLLSTARQLGLVA